MYDKINKVEVDVTKEKAFAIGRGTVRVNVGRNIELGGYHFYEFSCEILAAYWLLEQMNYYSHQPPTRCAKCKRPERSGPHIR